MIAPDGFGARELYVRLSRLRMALWAMSAARALDRLADRLLPADCRRRRAGRVA